MHTLLHSWYTSHKELLRSQGIDCTLFHPWESAPLSGLQTHWESVDCSGELHARSDDTLDGEIGSIATGKSVLTFHLYTKEKAISAFSLFSDCLASHHYNNTAQEEFAAIFLGLQKGKNYCMQTNQRTGRIFMKENSTYFSMEEAGSPLFYARCDDAGILTNVFSFFKTFFCL